MSTSLLLNDQAYQMCIVIKLKGEMKGHVQDIVTHTNDSEEETPTSCSNGNVVSKNSHFRLNSSPNGREGLNMWESIKTPLKITERQRKGGKHSESH